MDAEPVRTEPIAPEAVTAVSSASPLTIAALLAALESLSRAHPDRVLRLIGTLAAESLDPTATAAASSAATGGHPPLAPPLREPFELLIFRGFSSLTTHPTAFDPDRAALPEGAVIEGAELLAAPLDPQGGVPLVGPLAAEVFLQEASWL